MTTTEQFYVNYEFTDEKVNDNMELTEDRIIEMLDAFYEFKIKEENKIGNFKYIAKTKNINGTLLMEIERVMEQYKNEALNLTAVSQQRELLNFMEHLSMYHNIDEVIDCTKYQQIIEQYKI